MHTIAFGKLCDLTVAYVDGHDTARPTEQYAMVIGVKTSEAPTAVRSGNLWQRLTTPSLDGPIKPDTAFTV